jgi:hypothetical protein
MQIFSRRGIIAISVLVGISLLVLSFQCNYDGHKNRRGDGADTVAKWAGETRSESTSQPQPTPEPATLALVALGIGGVALMARRARAKKETK